MKLAAASLVVAALIVAGSAQPPPRAQLADVLSDPQRYDGALILVSEEVQSPPETQRYLCALGCGNSRSMRDLVLFYFPQEATARADLTRLDDAHRKARYVRITVVGRFRVCNGQCVPGPPPTFQFELAATKILRIETSNRPWKLDDRK